MQRAKRDRFVDRPGYLVVQIERHLQISRADIAGADHGVIANLEVSPIEPKIGAAKGAGKLLAGTIAVLHGHGAVSLKLNFPKLTGRRNEQIKGDFLVLVVTVALEGWKRCPEVSGWGSRNSVAAQV